MNKDLRKVVIAGNWKMNKTATETKALLAEMKEKLPESDATILLCVPAINIGTAMEAVGVTQINIVAQNCHWAESGAFTGEISGDNEEFYIMYPFDAAVDRSSGTAFNMQLTSTQQLGDYNIAPNALLSIGYFEKKNAS